MNGRKNPVARVPKAACLCVIVTLACILALPPSSEGRPQQDTGVLTRDRPWLHEDEFDLENALHATREQTVVLHLEPWDGRGKPIRKNSLRFLVEEAERFSFCIPREDPHLLRVKLKRLRGPTLINGARGGRCEPVKLEPGPYELDIFHDSREVPAGGRLAFLHQPEQPRLLGGGGTLLGADASSGQPDFMAFQGSNGQWVSAYQSPQNIMWAAYDQVYETEIWVMEQVKDNKYSLAYDNPDNKVTFDAPVAAVSPLLGPAWFYYDIFGNDPIVTQFIYHDQGGWKFTLDAFLYYQRPNGPLIQSVGPVVRDSSNKQLRWPINNSETYEMFTATLKGFDCSAGCDEDNLGLAKGEVALFSECDYKGTGAVSVTSVENLAALDIPTQGSLPPPQIVRSIRLGSGTFMILYPEWAFVGDPQGVNENQSCLTPAASVQSFRILTDARNFIVQTNGCVNCQLTGIDLGGLDLSNGIFTGASFLQSNLVGTDFSSAAMSDADLTGSTMTAAFFDGALLVDAKLGSGSLVNASFTGANLTRASFLAAADLTGTNFSGGAKLHCTSFESSDISVAVFDATPDIRRDFGCRLNLTGATLDYTTFAPTDWRYMTLATPHVSNVPDTLSTIDMPLDLSGIDLSGATWLSGKALDGINLGCAGVQTVDIDAVLNGSSQSNPVQVTLPAGTWTVTPAEGTYTSWNPWGRVTGCQVNGTGCSNGWENAYEFWSASLPNTRLTSNDVYATPELAFAYAQTGTFTLTQEETVNFTLTDSASSLGDNEGGMSLRLTSVDRPTACSAAPGEQVCATLQGTVLTETSLQLACLKNASMESAFLSFSNLDGADMSGVQLQALPSGNAATLEGAFMRNVSLADANLTGVRAHHVNFYPASGGTADATGLTAPGVDFTGAWLAFADFSGAGSAADLQGTTWTDAMLLGAKFDQANLGKDTSGGVNTGRTTTFEGAYMQGVSFANGTILDDVDFTDTYWDADGVGGGLNLLIPQSNLEFTGYWKTAGIPECPRELKWSSGTPPPAFVTNDMNTCPNALPGPCDGVWDQPREDIALALFKSADPTTDILPYPQDPTVSDPALQCGGSNNPADLCWTISGFPPPAQCTASP